MLLEEHLQHYIQQQTEVESLFSGGDASLHTPLTVQIWAEHSENFW